MKRLVFLMVLILLVGGCFSAKSLTTQPLTKYDEHTQYRIDDNQDGFTVTVYYSRYQFFTERYDIIAEVEEIVRGIALAHAEEDGKQIKPIDTSKAIMSWGRKPMPGITTCHYQVPMEYYD